MKRSESILETIAAFLFFALCLFLAWVIGGLL